MPTARIFLCFLLISLLTAKIRLFTDPDPPYLEFLNDDLPSLSFESLEAREDPVTGEIRLFATRPITQGEVILSIPSHGVFSSFDDFARSHFFFEMARNDHREVLMGRLAIWKSMFTFGFLFDYYLRTPNAPGINESFYFWSEEDYQFFLQRAGFLPNHDFDRALYEKYLTDIREFNLPLKDKYQPPFPAEIFEMDRLRFSMALVNQKAFPLTQHEYCLLNGLDPASWKRELKGMKLTDEARSKASKEGVALIPFFDLIENEEPKVLLPVMVELPQEEEVLQRFGLEDGNVKLTAESFTEQPAFDLFLEILQPRDFKSYWTIADKRIDLKANRNYAAGEKIRFFMGLLSNAKLLRDFGTIIPNNVFSGVSIPLPLQRYSPEEKTFFVSMGMGSKSEIFEKNLSTFHFHHYQLNHRYVNFLRIFLLKTEEIMPKFNKTKVLEIVKRGRFKNSYLEALLWYNYAGSLDTRELFGSTIQDDRKELQSVLEAKDLVKSMILETAIQEKAVIYKHLFGAWKKWARVYHYDINGGFIKKAILALIVDPNTMLFYSERD